MSSPPTSFRLPASVLEDAESLSGLNPNAAPFVPAYNVPAWMVTEAGSQRRVDDAMRSFHHLASVNDTETLLQAQQWLGKDPSEWMANGAEYVCAQREDNEQIFALEYEQRLVDGLYRAPNQPKGDTRGRARSR